MSLSKAKLGLEGVPELPKIVYINKASFGTKNQHLGTALLFCIRMPLSYPPALVETGVWGSGIRAGG